MRNNFTWAASAAQFLRALEALRMPASDMTVAV
jgi:hypothetical protein